MDQNNKSILTSTLVNLSLFGLAVSPLFEDMNLLRFLLIGFGVIFIFAPFSCGDDDEQKEK